MQTAVHHSCPCRRIALLLHVIFQKEFAAHVDLCSSASEHSANSSSAQMSQVQEQLQANSAAAVCHTLHVFVRTVDLCSSASERNANSSLAQMSQMQEQLQADSAAAVCHILQVHIGTGGPLHQDITTSRAKAATRNAVITR
jgi:hypothetical protein